MLERARGLAGRLHGSPPGRLFAKWNEDNGSVLAVTIAYYALFSLFPLLVLLTALAGFVVKDLRALAALQQDVVLSFPDDLAREINDALLSARTNAGSLGLLGVLGLLWSGSGLFGAMEQALDNVYRVPARGFVAAKLMAIAMMLVFIALLLLSVLASSFSTLVVSSTTSALAQELPDWLQVQRWLGWTISFVSLFALFLAIYIIVPNTPIHPPETIPGALVAAILFGVATQVVPVYLRYFGGSYHSYAAFGLLLLLMFWFFILGNIVVLGAELNAFIARAHLRVPQRSPRQAERGTHATSPPASATERSAPRRSWSRRVVIWATLALRAVWRRLLHRPRPPASQPS